MSGISPALLASGRDTDVFAIDDRRVLRGYRHDLDTAAEAAVMRHVAAHGFPVPHPHPGPLSPLSWCSGCSARKSRTASVALGAASCR